MNSVTVLFYVCLIGQLHHYSVGNMGYLVGDKPAHTGKKEVLLASTVVAVTLLGQMMARIKYGN